MQALGPYHQLVNMGVNFGTLISEDQEETTTFFSQEPGGAKACKISKAYMSGRILRERKRSKLIVLSVLEFSHFTETVL